MSIILALLDFLLEHFFNPSLSAIQYDETEVSPSQKEDANDIKQFYELLTSSMEVIRKWAKSIPGFCDFCPEDQELLLESAFVELFILRLAYRYVQLCVRQCRNTEVARNEN